MESNKKILVVDDEPLMRDFLVETLQRKKYLVEAVGNGSQAIEKVKAEYYDLVLTDMRMPEVTGMEVLKETKKVGLNVNIYFSIFINLSFSVGSRV